jgi:hypothetical protein
MVARKASMLSFREAASMPVIAVRITINTQASSTRKVASLPAHSGKARLLLGQREQANTMFDSIVQALDQSVSMYSEMVDPTTGEFLGNLPQGLTHLAMVHSIMTLAGVSFGPRS